MSLYASTIADPIEVITNPMTIGSTPSVPTETDYNYWSTEAEEDNTYVFNRSSNTWWKANNTVTINSGYKLKLITAGYNYCYDLVLYCNNTFTNDGNVIIDNYGGLDLNDTSTNTGAIYINNNGRLGLWNSAKLNNTGTITLKDNSYIYIYKSTLTNTGTIDISNITDLSEWYNEGTFKLEGGSIFILPKSITRKVNTSIWNKPITLNGSSNKPVNIVIPKGCAYITDISNNNKEELFNAIQGATGFTFNGERDNVKFSWQEDHVDKPIE
ncbi:MAG: hypothetical protein IJ481_00400 [Alphaproteobacteria bacterium]|nr:hypothetical protein [Alphaproteobacteria bacterium]